MWALFYLIIGSPIATITGIPSHSICENIKVQIVREFKPKKAACIELAQPQSP